MVEKIKEVYELGVSSIVISLSELGSITDNDSMIIDKLKEIVSLIGDIPIGISESTSPKRFLGANVLQYILSTDNILFYFDSCGSVTQLKEKFNIIGYPNHSFRVFNLNSTTFLESLTFGMSGYAGKCSTVYSKLF